MDEEYTDIEDEMDEIEDEIKKTPKAVPSRKQPTKTTEEREEPTERYTAFYQEARIGILDTLTGKPIVEGLSDLPTASLEALKLNKLDKIEIASGA